MVMVMRCGKSGQESGNEERRGRIEPLRWNGNIHVGIYSKYTLYIVHVYVHVHRYGPTHLPILSGSSLR